MSWKSDYIARFGEGTYAEKLAQRREWGRNLPGGEKQRSQDKRNANPEKQREYDRERARKNPEKVKEAGREVSRKGGKYYEKKQIYKQTGISGERERIRIRHGYYWRPYKRLIAPKSQIHHEWIPNTAKYKGVALVEANAHRYRVIDVILILEGEITLFTERHL